MSGSNNVLQVMPLSAAAKRMGLSEKALTQLVEAGKIQAVQTPSGELLVAADNGQYQTKEEIITKHFAHLRGKPITPYDAQKKYDIHRSNFTRWAGAGYIKILQQSSRLVKLDAADTAYCAYIYHRKKEEYGGRISGAKIFDNNGNPYRVKYPDLSAQRREQD